MEAANVPFDALREGSESATDYVITDAVMAHFLAAFDDRSPIHVDPAAAAKAGFAGPVAHGAILNGFLSHFVGMVLPGAGAVLLSTEIRHLHPSYCGDRLRLTVTVAQKVETQRAVVLHFRFTNLTRGMVVASGRAQVRVQSP
jgi:3-hydroxybutyryl-CoA dehydratase